MGWSEKYKRSIDCNNPKGFSQKAHCAGRKKRKNEEMNDNLKEVIIEILTEGVDDPGILKCIFMAGGPGSGKSYTAKEVFGVGKGLLQSFSRDGLKIVNSDTAFEKGLKDNGINPKDLAKIEKDDPELWDKITGKDSIRSKAKELTKKQQNFYEAGRLGMIIDGTGDEVSKIKKKKQHAEKLGYDCYMVFVNTSLEVALERNKNRDRVLSDELVTTIWKDCQNNLGAFQTMFGGNFVIVDNTVYKPVNKSVQKAIDKFIRKPIYNRIGKKWIQTARALKKAKLIKDNKLHSVNEAKEPEVISQLRDIVKGKQNKKIKDPISGKMMRVDLYSASAITKVYDAINKSNKDKFGKLSLPKMVNVAFSVIKKESVNEAMKPSQVRSAISKVKKGLMRKWKQKGGYENFGQKELSQMRDKFDYNPYGSSDERQIAKMLDGFDNWAMNYDGDMREARRSVVHKAAKKGSFPVSLVVVKNGKVIDQELVNTPEAVPAAFNVIQSKHKGAIVHIEDKTGKRLFSEAEIGDIGYVEKHKSIATIYGVMGKKLKVKLGKTGKVVTIDSKDIRIMPEGVNEMDMNDPILVKLRAAQMRKNKQAAKKIDTEKQNKNATKIKSLKKKRAEVMRDMEQEAEPEGGKIADRYGRILNKIDNDIIKLGGNPMTNEERINLFVEKNVPTNPSKWAYYKAQAKKKFDVYPSAYANGWAAKKYKDAGGGWRKEK